MKCTRWKMFETGEAILFRSSCIDDGFGGLCRDG